MLALSFLMISNVSYPAVPTIGFRKISEILGTLVVAATIFGVIFLKKQFYFPALVIYVLYGVAKTVFFGLNRTPARGETCQSSLTTMRTLSRLWIRRSPRARHRSRAGAEPAQAQAATTLSARRSNPPLRTSLRDRRDQRIAISDIVPCRGTHHTSRGHSGPAGKSG